MGIGGNNGGGNSTLIGKINNGYRAIGGDGATDIRLNISDLNSRIMVSGAPGGTYQLDMIGFAGGLTGQDGKISKDGTYVIGHGGTQISGGNGFNNGTFGYGANSTPGLSTDLAGAGGGGWFGGGSGYHSEYLSSGGGGSSYVSGFEKCQDISYKWRFNNIEMYNGSQQFREPDGSLSTFGHKGSGYCIITCLYLGSCQNFGINKYNFLMQYINVFILIEIT